jgi:hypothetical protein
MKKNSDHLVFPPDPELQDLLSKAPWKATNHVAPHEYVMEHWSKDVALLVDRVRAKIMNEGYWPSWGGATRPSTLERTTTGRFASTTPSGLMVSAQAALSASTGRNCRWASDAKLPRV